MSFNRQMSRKRKNEFNYKQYALDRKRELQQKAIDEKMKEINKYWLEIITRQVPQWAITLSTFIPPLWYQDFFNKILTSMPTNKYAESIIKKKWPQWRKYLNLLPIVWVRTVIEFLFYRSAIFIKRQFRCFGMKFKIRRITDTDNKMVIILKIYKWWRKIDEKEWVV